MTNNLAVLGFGQCGSKIAVDVSASFNPTNLTIGEAPMKFQFKFILSKFGRDNYSQKDDAPTFYIADLNASNLTYLHYTKAQAIRENLHSLENLSSTEIIEKINKGRTGVLLEDVDIPIVEEVKKKHEALKKIKALYFEANKAPLLQIGGAGGKQYLSEAIANQDQKLLGSIDPTPVGALIGIFSLGGGTGSGSLFSILSQYRAKTTRYTIGLGVLPVRTNSREYINAGRYLTKYIGTDDDERFHTLFLFSNEEAQDVLVEDITQHEDNSELQIINEFIAAFIHDFSLINDSKTVTLHGKQFDPMDAKANLQGICSVGYCADRDFSPAKLFAKAISPMRFEKGLLSGLTVRTTREQYTREKREEVICLVDKIVHIFATEKFNSDDIEELSYERLDCQSKDPKIESLKKDIRLLHDKTPFYRTIKKVQVFYFLTDKSYEWPTRAFVEKISQLFKALAGNESEQGAAIYFVPASEATVDSVLVVFNGGFSFDIYESIMEYAEKAFVREKSDRSKFVNKFNSYLATIKEKDASQFFSGEFKREIENFLSDEICLLTEGIGSKGNADLLKHPDLKEIVTQENLDKILVKRNDLVSTLVELIYNFALGNKKPEIDVSVFENRKS